MTAAAAAQTTVGGPYTRLGRRKQVGNAARSITTGGVFVFATSVLYLLFCVVSRMPVSITTERKTSKDIRNKNQLRLADWQIGVVQLLLIMNRNLGS